MAKLSIAEVEEIAELAKLTLTEAEKKIFQEQLSEVLNYAAMLQQVDTTDVPPTASALPLINIMRTDEVTGSLSTKDALANAPAAEDNQFKVQAILE